MNSDVSVEIVNDFLEKERKRDTGGQRPRLYAPRPCLKPRPRPDNEDDNSSTEKKRGVVTFQM